MPPRSATPSDGGSNPVAPREKFSGRTDQGSNKKLAMVLALLAAVGVVIWFLYTAMAQYRSASAERRPEIAASASPMAFRIEQPKALAEKPVQSDDRYDRLLAMLSAKFAEYDARFAKTPQPEKVPERLNSVIFTNSNRANVSAIGRPSQSGDSIGEGGGNAIENALAALMPGGGAAAMPGETGVDNLLKPSVLTGERAGKMPNRNFLIAQGSALECVLETAIDTTVPGMTTCVLSRDIYSDNARVLLLEKGSKLIGEYRGALRSGSQRLFLIWSRIVTPKGVAIQLASPGTDLLGRAGVDGYVDNRYFERFGLALLVSILADTIPPVVQGAFDDASQNTGLSIELRNTSKAGESMGNEILRQNALVPPILRKNQGDLVNIMVARDLDFSSIYSLSLK